MQERGAALVIVTMVFGVLMDGIDGSIVNVALPSIAHSFLTDTSVVSWVTIGYFLMLAGLLLPFGRIADAGHIRKVFLAGFAVFTVGSLACALSPTLAALVASRLLQGVGAAALAAVAPMICVKLLPARHLGKSLGIMTVAAALGFAIGPGLGGIIIEYLSWHWIFLINIPLGLAAIAVGHLALPVEESRPVSVDVKGAALLFAAIGFGVYALERMSYPDERAMCVASGALAAVFIVLFAVESLRSKDPLLDVRLFRIRDLDLTLLSYTVVNLVYMGVLYILPFYMTLELGLSSLMSGVLLLVPSLVSLVLSVPVGGYTDTHGRRTVAVAASALSVVYSAALLVLEPSMGMYPVLAVALVIGVMWGLSGPASSGRIVDSLPEREKAIGSSLMNFMVYVGGTVGTALFASLLTSGAGSAGVSVEDLTTEAFMSGMGYAMVWAVAISVVGLVAAWAVDERRARPERDRGRRAPAVMGTTGNRVPRKDS